MTPSCEDYVQRPNSDLSTFLQRIRYRGLLGQVTPPPGGCAKCMWGGGGCVQKASDTSTFLLLAKHG